MRHLLLTLVTSISIFLTCCSSSSVNGNTLASKTPGPQPDKTQQVVIGYLSLNDWEFENQFSTIEWKHLTHINASFAHVKADGSLNINAVQERIGKVRDTAHKNGVKILISIAKNNKGDFAAAINDSAAQEKLIDEIITFTRKNLLDGFDIDYEEYENWDVYFPSLLVFVQGLNAKKDKDMLMTCAVNSRWLKYGTEWQQYFDYINLMSYDRGAFSNTPTQHASYEDFVKDLTYWNEQCCAPKNKIVGGLPFYGYSWDESLKGVVDDVRGIRYSSILKQLGKEAAEEDNIGKTYYNGRGTIKKKCNFINENKYAGVMIWQLFQDAHQDNYSLKLINVVGEAMQQ